MRTMSHPRIAYVTTAPVTMWAFLDGQNAYLKSRGYELHAVSSPGPELDRLVERDGLVAHPVAISRTVSPLRDLVSLLRLTVVLRRIRPTIVHLSTPKAALLGSIAAWLARVPVRVFLVRGLITENARGARRSLFRRLERLTSQLCHQSLCVAPSLLDYARWEGIVAPDRGRVLARGMSNGIDPRRFDPEAVPAATPPAGWNSPGSAVIGFVGRLARDKGVEDLYEAWRSIREEFPAVRLLLVGPWEAEDPVSPRVREGLESDPRVWLAGQQADVAPYYRIMSLLVFPSHGTEGFPNAPMEAASMALPVVATRVVGCVDAVVDGVTGTLVPPRDPQALATAMREYLAFPERRREHGRNGRERVVGEFRRELIWEALDREYNRLLREKGLAVPTSASSPPSEPGTYSITV